ncbi:MAG: oxidoreductase [Sulfuritalea sp.]|jgi:NAD(P)-dependent dehydrogenase (short-subunit alcohol dehydrogenase family)|nr:oxidoreductase [Sulfuritalea sp.]
MLRNKVVVVTGGAGVIGRCLVRGIAQKGGIAVAADIDLDAANRLANEIGQDDPGRVVAAQLDITSKDSICSLISDLRQRYGRIDAIVNNAYPRNKNYGRKLEAVTYADFCENVDMHLGGYFLVAQQFCLAFKEMGGGNVVNMSSIYGTMAPRFEVYDGTPMTMPVEYAAIKSAVIQLTRYFAQYFKGDGIRVNCLSPGGILADQPADFLTAYNDHCASKGMLAPQDVLGSLLFLLSDESRYITGQNLLVDDGFSL